MGRHYLIGHGERLSEPIVLPRGGATPKDIYTYEESRARLQPELHSAIANLPDDPALAQKTFSCDDDSMLMLKAGKTLQYCFSFFGVDFSG